MIQFLAGVEKVNGLATCKMYESGMEEGTGD
jgi:hypothetical protein